jgi:hypothetical protein
MEILVEKAEGGPIMAKESLVLSAQFPASVAEIHDAWLDPKAHAAMTGAPASIRDDGSFVAWDGYITARTLLDEPDSIVQSWRTTEFPSDSPDSQVELALAAVRGGTRVTITHTNIPAGQAGAYAGDWEDYYFGPMQRWFEAANAARRGTDAATPVKKKAATPVKKKATPPVKKKAATPVKKKAATPVKKKAATPVKKKAATRAKKKKAAAPAKKKVAAPVKKKVAAAPVKKKVAAAPAKKTTATKRKRA